VANRKNLLTLRRERPDAVLVGTTAFLNGRRVQLAHLATFHRLPAIYALRDYAEAGGLMSYGSDIVNGFRQVGLYTGRILKGAKPADLPVVQANKFELVINAQTARMFGLAVPDKLLAVADQVIEWRAANSYRFSAARQPRDRSRRAQQAAMPVVGLLAPGDAAFHQGLQDTGFVERQNVAIEYRWAENQNDRLPALAADLVRRQVIVIAAPGSSRLRYL
jgi:ABC transporter substrate binding protein